MSSSSRDLQRSLAEASAGRGVAGSPTSGPDIAPWEDEMPWTDLGQSTPLPHAGKAAAQASRPPATDDLPWMDDEVALPAPARAATPTAFGVNAASARLGAAEATARAELALRAELAAQAAREQQLQAEQVAQAAQAAREQTLMAEAEAADRQRLLEEQTREQARAQARQAELQREREARAEAERQRIAQAQARDEKERRAAALEARLAREAAEGAQARAIAEAEAQAAAEADAVAQAAKAATATLAPAMPPATAASAMAASTASAAAARVATDIGEPEWASESAPAQAPASTSASASGSAAAAAQAPAAPKAARADHAPPLRRASRAAAAAEEPTAPPVHGQRYEMPHRPARQAPAEPESALAGLELRLIRLATRGLLGLALLAALGWAGAWLLHGPWFNFKRLEVRGELNHHSAESLRNEVLGKLHGGFFSLRLPEAKAAFEAAPWVREARVSRVWPDVLVVQIEEYRAAAVWEHSDSDDQLLDPQGRVFDASIDDLSQEEADSLPVLAGPNRASAPQVLSMHRQLAPLFAGLKQKLARLELTERGSWKAQLASQAVIELGRGDEAEVVERTRRFVSTVGEVAEKYGRRPIVSADLRHRGAYALSLQGMSTVSATAAKGTQSGAGAANSPPRKKD